MTEINGVTVEQWEDRYTDVVLSVSEELGNWLGSSWSLSLATSRLMERVADLAERNDWSAVGILCVAGGNPWTAELQVDDHGRGYYGGMHLCAMARGESEQERATELLQQANAWDCPEGSEFSRYVSRETWITSDDVLFYDVGARYTAEAVARLESDLSESALHDEDRVHELMEQVAEKTFRLPTVMGAEPDHYEVFATYVQMNHGELCPECGIAVDEVEALKQHYGDDLVDCFDCNDLVLWDGYGQRPKCCEFCERERANASVDSEQEDDSDGRMEHFDHGTGDGLVIRHNDGSAWRWDAVAAEWKHTPQLWERALNI